jgi:hypothetical protein
MTTVEWLEKKLKKRYDLMNSEPIFEQAKQMHKEEIEDAFQDGKWDWAEHIANGTESKDLTQYYKETFKK